MSRPTADVPTVYGSSATLVTITAAGAVARDSVTDPDTGYAWPSGLHVRSDDFASSDGIATVYVGSDATDALMWFPQDILTRCVRHVFTGEAYYAPADCDALTYAMVRVAQDHGPNRG